jgi:hypothetical protein
MSFSSKWVELENIILSEVSQAQKAKNCMSPSYEKLFSCLPLPAQWIGDFSKSYTDLRSPSPSRNTSCEQWKSVFLILLLASCSKAVFSMSAYEICVISPSDQFSLIGKGLYLGMIRMLGPNHIWSTSLIPIIHYLKCPLSNQNYNKQQNKMAY